MALVFLLIGIATGFALAKVLTRINEGSLSLNWYHWLIGFGLYAGFAMLVAFIGVSIGEQEPQAAGMAILLFGGALLVVTLLTYRLLYRPQIFPVNE
jgi:hypothetical protein